MSSSQPGSRRLLLIAVTILLQESSPRSASAATGSTIASPHDWGHDKSGTRLGVASGSPGVNSNALSPGHLVDAISGNAMVNGFEVSVAAASA